MHTKRSSFNHRKVLDWNSLFVIFPFYLFLTLILKISSESPELGILCPFQTPSYLSHCSLCSSRLTSTDVVSGLPDPQASYLVQSLGDACRWERSWGIYHLPPSLQAADWLWLCSSPEGHHFSCVAFSYSSSRSSFSVPAISLPCPCWLSGGKGSTLTLVLGCYPTPHMAHNTEHRTDNVIGGAPQKMKMQEPLFKNY